MKNVSRRMRNPPSAKNAARSAGVRIAPSTRTTVLPSAVNAAPSVPEDAVSVRTTKRAANAASSAPAEATETAVSTGKTIVTTGPAAPSRNGMSAATLRPTTNAPSAGKSVPSVPATTIGANIVSPDDMKTVMPLAITPSAPENRIGTTGKTTASTAHRTISSP